MYSLKSLRQARRSSPIWGLYLGLVVALAACAGGVPQTKNSSPALVGEPTFVAAMVGPLTKETPLQIVSLFAYEPGEALISPATELAALVTEQRTRGDFGKEPLRLLTLETPPDSIKTKRLLFIALGSRADFSLDRVREVGATAMRETLRLGVEQMAFAPVVRDQGVTQFSAAEVAAAFVEAALVEWDAEHRTNPQTHLKEITYEAGPAFIESVQAALPRGITAAHARRHSAPVSP